MAIRFRSLEKVVPGAGAAAGDTSAAGCGPISLPASCSRRSWCPKGWPTPSWPGCPRSRACTRRSRAWSATRSSVRRGCSCSGPDSSISPMIFAAITPLLVAGDDPAKAIALAGMLALLVGLIEIGLGLGKLGFVADLLSSEVQVGYMNGLAVTIIVGQLPKLFGFSTDADRFFERGRRVLHQPRRDGGGERSLVGVGVLVAPARASAGHAASARRCSSPWSGATVVSAILDLASKAWPRSARCRRAFPRRTVPWTERERRRAAADRRDRHHARVADRHDRDGVELRGSPRRRGRPEPGDDRDRAPRTSRPGFFQGFAVSTSGSRTAVAEQSGAKSQLTGLVGAGVVVASCLLFLNSLLADLPAVGARGGRHRGRALADGLRVAACATRESAASAFVLSLVATRRRRSSSACSRGS